MLQGAARVVGEQAFDAEAHVGEAAGGVEARAEDEAEIEGCRLRRIAAGGLEQGGEAGLQLAGAHALQALADEDAVVAVELTTSATVPSATRSSRLARLGSGRRRRQPRSRSSARRASIT